MALETYTIKLQDNYVGKIVPNQ